MKIAFLVYNEFFSERVMQLLEDAGIDYYTRWERVTGKGHKTEPHLGQGAFGSTNCVLMIAFRETAPLDTLIQSVTSANAEVNRPDDKIRLFQLPLERMV